MPERRFDTRYWDDPFIMRLSLKAKLLYIYLWTNLHCNQAGFYEIAPETISFQTGLTVEEIPELIRRLEPKVTWWPELSLVWVKNFLRRQSKSPQFLTAAAKCLETINNNGLVKDFITFNEKHNLSIPYQYPIDTPEVSTNSSALSISSTDSLSLSSLNKGLTNGADVKNSSEEDQEIISVWSSVNGFAMQLPTMAELLSKIRADFPDVDILGESKKWAARKLSEPLTKTSRVSSQIYNFMANRHEWNQEPRRRKSIGEERPVLPKIYQHGS
jgi:hypothetical protein